MKPIHLNLAARPYRDYRPVYAVVVVVSLITAWLMLNNIDTYYQYMAATRDTRGDISKLEQQTQTERQKADTVERRLRTLDLRLLDGQTKFINAKLRERSFSWSVLLDELETILPRDVRIQSISPTVSPTGGAVNLSLTLEGKAADGMTTVLERLLHDPQFSNPFPTSETVANGMYEFGINVKFYPPGVANPNAVATVGSLKAAARPAKGVRP